MTIPVLESVKTIEQQYRTGEEPVLVMCSDKNAYVCKYMRSSNASFKLACELIGSVMAKAWHIETPEIAFVRIKSEHWAGRFVQHSLSAPSLGSRRIEGVVDVTPSTNGDINFTIKLLRQLLKISLFDFWIANEDRNVNNANLLYSVVQGNLISIDYGCILNTATFDYPMSQLTSNESILCSDLFRNIIKDKEISGVDNLLNKLDKEYRDSLIRSEEQMPFILRKLPIEWHVPSIIVEDKLKQLFDEEWTMGVWNGFVECLNYNISNE